MHISHDDTITYGNPYERTQYTTNKAATSLSHLLVHFSLSLSFGLLLPFLLLNVAR